jgi:hypothetical protein
MTNTHMMMEVYNTKEVGACSSIIQEVCSSMKQVDCSNMLEEACRKLEVAGKAFSNNKCCSRYCSMMLEGLCTLKAYMKCRMEHCMS